LSQLLYGKRTPVMSVK